MVIKQKTNISNKGEVKKMKRSKLVVSLMLVLLIVIQSMTAFAGYTVNLGNAVVNSDGVRIITGNTLTTDQPSVGQSVYYDFEYSGGTTGSAISVIQGEPSVSGSVYTYELPNIILPQNLYEDVSVTASVYESSTLNEVGSENYNFSNGIGNLYQVQMDTAYYVTDEVYGDDIVRNTVYGSMYGDNVRISMPFNTIANEYDITYEHSGNSILYVNGQDIASQPSFDLQESSEGGKCDTVALSVYKNKIVHNYNLDVYLNTPGTATVDFEYPLYENNLSFDETPEYFFGTVSDEDSGNVGINSVQYTLQNSDGNYLEYDYNSYGFNNSVTGLVYNQTYFTNFYDSDFNYNWFIPIDTDSYKFPASTYTLTAFANDGEDGTPVTSTFTIKAPTTTDPGTTTGPAIEVPTTTGPAISTGGGIPAPQTEATVSKDGSITLPAVTPDSKGNSVIPVSADTLKKSLEQVKPDADGVKTVKLTIPKAAGAKAYVPEFPVANLSSTGDIKFEIATEFGTVLIPSDMLKAADVVGAKTVGISIASADTSGLSEELKKKIGKNPVLDFKLLVDGKELSWNNASAPVVVTVPYTLTASEALNPELLTVWYIDSKGNAVAVPSARYNSVLKTITFSTTHFSKYALVYNNVTFSDISKSYAKKSIEVLASKGITTGTAIEVFSPKANVTRADFLVMLVNALGLNADIASNFSDVKSTDSFYNAVGIAKKLGIVSGRGNGTFDPNVSISRQDMMVMAVNAMKIAKKPLSSTTDLKKFKDASSIAAYAKDSVASFVSSGIIVGSAGAIMPTSSATREQAAVIIYKLYNK